MRVVFMGTPDFAVPSLELLIRHDYEVCAVYTQPDKPKGRGHKLQPPPVKELALRHNIPVFQPVNLRGGGHPAGDPSLGRRRHRGGGIRQAAAQGCAGRP